MNCGGWSVTGVNNGIGRQGHEFGKNTFHQLVIVSARKIGAADAPFKQYISNDDKICFTAIQGNTSKGMAGNMKNL